MAFGYRGFPMYALFFAVDSIAAMSRWVPGKELAIASLSTCRLVIAACWLVPAWHAVFYNVANQDGYAVQGGGATALLGLPFAIRTARSPARSRVDRLLGDASYSPYLAHRPVATFLFSRTIGTAAAWAL